MTYVVTVEEVAQFQTFGFVVLRGAFQPGPLSAELDLALKDGFRSSFEVEVGGAGIEGRYLPMMCERTPVSLLLLDQFAGPAAQLLGGPALPLRAKGIEYFRSTSWHHDTDLEIASIGFACYLEPLNAESGALRVLPGSHRAEYGAAVERITESRPTHAAIDDWITAMPDVALETDPGDVIVFDEHLYHASTGGRNRRQWRVDYFLDPGDAVAEARVRAYLAETYVPGWDGGYEVDHFPSYGDHWLASGRPAVKRLEQLGAYDLAAAEEAFARSRRSEPTRPR